MVLSFCGSENNDDFNYACGAEGDKVLADVHISGRINDVKSLFSVGTENRRKILQGLLTPQNDVGKKFIYSECCDELCFILYM